MAAGHVSGRRTAHKEETASPKTLRQMPTRDVRTLKYLHLQHNIYQKYYLGSIMDLLGTNHCFRNCHIHHHPISSSQWLSLYKIVTKCLLYRWRNKNPAGWRDLPEDAQCVRQSGDWSSHVHTWDSGLFPSGLLSHLHPKYTEEVKKISQEMCDVFATLFWAALYCSVAHRRSEFGEMQSPPWAIWQTGDTSLPLGI